MTVSDQIIAVLNDLCAKFGVAIDWSAENVVPYVTELCDRYIRYEIATSIAWALIVTIIPAILLIIAHKHPDEDVSIPCSIIGCVGAVIAFITVSFQIFDIIECVTIPEKTIFEYVRIILRSSP